MLGTDLLEPVEVEVFRLGLKFFRRGRPDRASARPPPLGRGLLLPGFELRRKLSSNSNSFLFSTRWRRAARAGGGGDRGNVRGGGRRARQRGRGRSRRAQAQDKAHSLQARLFSSALFLNKDNMHLVGVACKIISVKPECCSIRASKK